MKWAITLIGLLTLPLLFNLAPLEVMRLKTFDALVTTPEPTGYFTILNIDEQFLDEQGGYPLPRKTLAKIHKDIIDAGAMGVGWVMLFPHPDRLGGDDAFSLELSKSPSIIAMPEIPNGLYPPTVGTVIKGPIVSLPKAQGFLQNIDVLKESANQGAISAPVDVDNLVRRIPLLQQTNNGWVASFGTEVLKILGGGQTYQIVTNQNGIEQVRVRGIPPIPTDSLGRKWISWVDTPQTTIKEMNVKDKFVFVGVTAKGIMPTLATPNGLLEPHKIQSALAESILINSPFVPDYRLFVELLILTISGLIVAFVINYFGITWGLVLASASMVSVASLGYYFISIGYLIDVTWSMTCMTLLATQQFYINFRTQFKLRQQIKKQFGTYLSTDMVAMLQKNPELLKLGGERKEMTFLFTDIMGFTPVSEVFKNKDDPEGLVELINTYLDKMTKIILANGGTIDKYMGDCIMAFWNAPLACNNHAELAIKSAIEIEQATIELNKQFEEQELGLPPINVGTGVNSGTCIVGNMGSETRFDYSVVGDAVNLSARLEATAGRNDYKQWKIIISEYTKELAGDCFDYEKIDSILVKGKSEPITIYFPTSKS
jgi:adenylate cyclase